MTVSSHIVNGHIVTMSEKRTYLLRMVDLLA